MGEIPETIATALTDVPVADRRCLEAGAGDGVDVGQMYSLAFRLPA
jgi:hypothetical protein